MERSSRRRRGYRGGTREAQRDKRDYQALRRRHQRRTHLRGLEADMHAHMKSNKVSQWSQSNSHHCWRADRCTDEPRSKVTIF
jgi:hypothetical protein